MEENMEKKSDVNQGEQYAFSVQMTTKEVFRFSLHHSYFKWSGIVGLLMSVTAIILLVITFSQLGDRERAVLVIVALWFIVLEPLTLWTRARGQAKRNPAYKKPLIYSMDETGITVAQDEQRQSVEWKQLFKIVETSSQYLVYSSRIYAFVFPKKSMGEQSGDMERFMARCAFKHKVKMSRKMKRFLEEKDKRDE